MAVYVDDLQEYPIEMVAPLARQYGTRWAHMTADSVQELLQMARKLKLSPAYMQRGGIANRIVHFDLVPSKRAQAIRLGAIATTTTEMIARYDDATARD